MKKILNALKWAGLAIAIYVGIFGIVWCMSVVICELGHTRNTGSPLYLTSQQEDYLILWLCPRIAATWPLWGGTLLVIWHFLDKWFNKKQIQSESRTQSL